MKTLFFSIIIFGISLLVGFLVLNLQDMPDSVVNSDGDGTPKQPLTPTVPDQTISESQPTEEGLPRNAAVVKPPNSPAHSALPHPASTAPEQIVLASAGISPPARSTPLPWKMTPVQTGGSRQAVAAFPQAFSTIGAANVPAANQTEELEIVIPDSETLPAIVALATSGGEGSVDAEAPISKLSTPQQEAASQLLEEYLSSPDNEQPATLSRAPRRPRTVSEIDEQFRSLYGNDAYMNWSAEAAKLRLNGQSPAEAAANP